MKKRNPANVVIILRNRLADAKIKESEAKKLYNESKEEFMRRMHENLDDDRQLMKTYKAIQRRCSQKEYALP